VEPNNIRVLVIDDERPIRRFLRTALTAHGYTVLEAADGATGLNAAALEHPDLVILDLGLPDMDGLEVVRRLREWSRLPVIILSVRDQEQDKVDALDAGADDYLTKPFGIAELQARIRTSLRHAMPSDVAPVFQSGDLEVDLLHRQVKRQGEEISLTPIEYDILRSLVQNAGKVLTHRQLLRMVWGHDYETESHLLRVNISNLRHKLEDDPSQPRYIITEPGVGYRLVG
jgi:two-component system, OmpR family, KDP operon response regulator KdpE